MMKLKPVVRLTLISILLFMSRGMAVPISSVMWHSMGASYTVIGLLGTVNAIAMIVASPLWGKASDRLGQRKSILRIGLGMLAISTGAVLLLPDEGYLWLVPVVTLMSIAQAAFSTASLALMGDWLEYQRQLDGSTFSAGRRMGIYRGFASLGFGSMAFISGSIADQISLRLPFAFAVVFLLGAFILSIGLEEAPHKQEIGGQEHELATDSSPRLPLVPLLVAAFAWSLAFGAVYAVWGNYMVDHLGYTAAQMTRLWALASLSEFPLMILAGWLSDRVGRLPMLCIGFILWVMVFAGYLWLPVMPWLLLIQLLRGFAYSAHTATAMTYATEVRARAERGRATGLYDTFGALGSIFGSTIGGGLAEYWGFPSLIATGAGIFLVGAMFLGGSAVIYQQKRN